VIKPAYSVYFLLSVNIFVWQNVLYFPDDLRILFFNFKGANFFKSKTSGVSENHIFLKVKHLVCQKMTFFKSKIFGVSEDHIFLKAKHLVCPKIIFF
jgi:hypothetical protein